MPISPNNLQFSLSSDYLEKLKKLAKSNESLGLCAKRALIQLLDGIYPNSSEFDANYNERLSQLEQQLQDFNLDRDRLSQLEERFKALEEDRDRLLIRIATLQDEKRELLEKPIQILMDELTEVHNSQLHDFSRTQAKVENLESALNRIEETIKEDYLKKYLQDYLSDYLKKYLPDYLSPKSQPVDLENIDTEINLLDENQSLTTTEIDKTLNTNKSTLETQPKKQEKTSAELATFLGVSPSTVSRWTKDGKSHEGWEFNLKTKKWINNL